MRDKPWWPWVKRGVSLVFFALVAALLVHFAQRIDWDEVRDSVREMPRHVLWMAGALCVASHLLYSCFDLIGRAYTRHRLAVPKNMQVNWISYAFNLNFGSMVGGVAFRFRLYRRLGLSYATITRVLTLSMLTNWLGYLLIAGMVFIVAPLQLPPEWKLDSEGLRWLGVVLLLVALVYLVLCGWSKKRSWTVRGHEFFLPPPGMALVQLAMSCANWMIIAAAVTVLLQGRVDYASVLSVLLIAAGSGLIVRVPGGLGVLEAVFIALLSHRVPEGQLLAALLTYRALYYIVPLGAAALLYLSVEMRARKHAHA
jgi:uncharacterized membrane protein YbhN (UPF0104 family)